MKKFLIIFAGVLCATHGFTQESDEMSVTLPSGRVVHFETEEQKAKFVAARERVATAATTPVPAGIQAAAPPSMGHTAADAIPAMGGKVNVSAPTFTADYHLFAPETWLEKPVTLSVAYIHRENSNRTDGLVELEAHTYGTLQGNGEQHSGEEMMIVATPAAAERISTLAGTRYHLSGWNTKTPLFKGTLKKSPLGPRGTTSTSTSNLKATVHQSGSGGPGGI